MLMKYAGSYQCSYPLLSQAHASLSGWVTADQRKAEISAGLEKQRSLLDGTCTSIANQTTVEDRTKIEA